MSLIRVLQEATESEIVSVKANTAIHDTVTNEAKYSARFPHKNFNDVIPAAFEKKKLPGCSEWFSRYFKFENEKSD